MLTHLGAVGQTYLNRPQAKPACAFVESDRRRESVDNIQDRHKATTSSFGRRMIEELSSKT